MTNKPKLSKKLRKGDRVMAIAGNSRGQIGTVLSRTGDKVLVQGLNIVKKHVKRSQTQQGGIVEIEKPIHASNLKVVTGEDKPVKLKTRVKSDGERELVYQDGKKEVVYRSLKKTNT